MNKILGLVVLCVLSIPLSAQTVTIKESGTLEPLEWVTLSSEQPKAFGITNAKGQADLSPFLNAEKIEIRKLGFHPKEISYEHIINQKLEIILEPTLLNLEEVVISATRWQQNSTNIPSKIQTISAEKVAFQNPQTAADLLGISGKVFIQKSQQGGGSPMIRGFATNRLLYAVDGVRMNTAIFRSGNIQNVISLDPFAIENTEVMFGPGSVTYGSDAIGGVMSFQTLVPELSLDKQPLVFGKAIVRYSAANNEKTGHFDVNVGWRKWAFVTSFSSFDYDNLRQGRHGPKDYLKPYYVQRIDSTDKVITQDDPLLQIPSAYSQVNLMQKIRFKPSENWDIQYGFHYSETSPYGRYDRHNRIKNGLPRYSEWKYGPQVWNMHLLSISHQKSTLLYDRLTLRLAGQYFEESRIDRSLNKTDRTTNTEKVNAYSINFDMLKSFGKHNLSYGLEYVVDDVNSSGLITNISTGLSSKGPSRYPQATWESIAVFVNDQFILNDQWSIQAGLRYNRYILNATFDTTFYPFPFTTSNLNHGALTGSYGMVFRPSESWVLSANYATAFRSPNVDDMGKVFDSEPGAVTVPNPNLKAEYANSFDIGMAKVIANHVKLDLSSYYTILNNAMVRRSYQLNGEDSIMYDGVLSRVQAIQNAANAYVYGIQAGLEANLGDGFQLSSTINWQHGKEELNDGTTSPSRHAAPMFGVSRLTYHNKKFEIQFYASYQAKRSFDKIAVEERGKTEIYALDSNGNPYSPAWYTLNIKAMYHLSDFLSITSGMENLTDQRYRSYSSGISGAGRNFLIALKANF